MQSGTIHLRSALEGVLDSTVEDTPEHRIARYLLENCYVSNHVTIADVAEHCYASKSTVSRFCRTIGYRNFQELNQAMMQAYLTPPNDQFERYLDTEDYRPLFYDDVEECLEIIRRHTKPEDVDQIARDLLTHRRVGILGHLQSSAVSLSLQHDLLSLRKVTEAPTRANTQYAFLENSGKDSFVMVISCMGDYLTTLPQRLTYPASDRPRLCLVTNNVRSAHDENFDYVICLPCDNIYAQRTLLVRLFVSQVVIRYAQLVHETH